MILGTNSDCKILKTEITEQTATITLLIFATTSTVPSKAFYLYMQDDGVEERYRIDNNVYWVDSINGYNSTSTNININKYKEISFKIDITNKNNSQIIDNKWVRNIYIYLVDANSATQKVCWSSGKVSLVSNEFEVPEIHSISFETKNTRTDTTTNISEAQIKTHFKLRYSFEKDFNYKNKNILSQINIRNINSNKVLEKITIPLTTQSNNSITSTNYFTLGEPLAIDILLTNNAGTILKKVSKIYKPFRKLTNTYIKTENGVKKVLAFYVATDRKQEHEGEWLE